MLLDLSVLACSVLSSDGDMSSSCFTASDCPSVVYYGHHCGAQGMVVKNVTVEFFSIDVQLMHVCAMVPANLI